ncbi:hypothetical protein PQD09_gp17 [Providencia phage PSTCR4]|uniref:Uncharacterized protein n=1 Tax=Providencia phage PSTCR4 TaxID=2783546 RepID=A0A873WRV6_9CAUD|nr:hypothetical protein PQD09_gp17 [Providencia phage PSTCR4]QPB12038.1 hypothetical protein [Providencia phage PSTCR4]
MNLDKTQQEFVNTLCPPAPRLPLSLTSDLVTDRGNWVHAYKYCANLPYNLYNWYKQQLKDK